MESRTVRKLLLLTIIVVTALSAEGCGSPDVESLVSKQDVDGLIKAVRNNDPAIAIAAAEALGQIGDERAVEPLIANLKSHDYAYARYAAAEALVQINKERAVEPLIAALEYYELNREPFIQALGQIGDERAVEPLITILHSPTTNRFSDGGRGERTAAVQALGQLGDARAVEPLIRRLKISQGDGDEAEAVVEALVQLGSAEAIEPLIDILYDNNESSAVRESAAKILGQIGNDRAAQALEALRKREPDDPVFDNPGISIYASIIKAVDLALKQLYRPLEDTLSPVCSGNGVSAAAYRPSDPGPYPVVILEGGRMPRWALNLVTNRLGSPLPIDTPEDTQLVLCISQRMTEIETCEYQVLFERMPREITITRYKGDFTLVLREASTGQEVASGSLEAFSDACPYKIGAGSSLYSHIKRPPGIPTQALEEWLRPYVR